MEDKVLIKFRNQNSIVGYKNLNKVIAPCVIPMIEGPIIVPRRSHPLIVKPHQWHITRAGHTVQKEFRRRD